jgi:site-specific recombinase XerD
MPSKKLPDVLTLEEQQALLKRPNPKYPTGERNRLHITVAA